MSRYDWDPEKAFINFIKHGVTFDEAETVDLDPNRRIFPDPLHEAGDDRFIVIGHSREARVLVVITSERGPRPRIISARRATKRERHAYEARP